MIPQFLLLNPIPQRGQSAAKPCPESDDFDAVMVEVKSKEESETDLATNLTNALAAGQNLPQAAESVQIEQGNSEAESLVANRVNVAEVFAATEPMIAPPDAVILTANLSMQAVKAGVFSNVDSENPLQSSQFEGLAGLAIENTALIDTMPQPDRQIKKTTLELAWQMRLNDTQSPSSGRNTPPWMLDDATAIAASDLASVPNTKAVEIANPVVVNFLQIPKSENETEIYPKITAIDDDPKIAALPLVRFLDGPTLKNQAVIPKFWPISNSSESEIAFLPDESSAVLNTAISPDPNANNPLKPDQFVHSVFTQLLPHFGMAGQAGAEISLLPVELGRLQIQMRKQVNSVQVVLTTQQPATFDILKQNSENLLNEFRQLGLSNPTLTFEPWDEPVGQSAVQAIKTFVSELPTVSVESDNAQDQDYLLWDAKPVAIMGALPVNADLAWHKPEQFVHDLKQPELAGVSSGFTQKTAQHFAPEVFKQLLPYSAAAKSGGMELSLSPIELGQVKFQIHQSADAVRVVLSAERSETLELFKRNSEQLLQEFKQAGFSGASLSFGQWNQQEKTAQTPAQPVTLFDEDLGVAAPILPRPTNIPTALPSGQGLDLRL
jgi:Flagellar hook-length control protein FliK